MSIQNKGVVRKRGNNDCKTGQVLNGSHFQDASGLLSAASALSKPAEDIGNDSRVEALWAIKAMEHSQVYFNVSFNRPTLAPLQSGSRSSAARRMCSAYVISDFNAGLWSSLFRLD